MRWPEPKRSLAALLGALLWAGVADAAPEAAPTPAPQKLDLPVPVGEPIKGIKIPQYDEQGNLTMNLTADTARKLDENRVELQKLKVQFSEKENQEIIVEIPSSILDLESKVVKADSETVIRREDFEIVGETAEFDTVARHGRLNGHVRASFRNNEANPLP